MAPHSPCTVLILAVVVSLALAGLAAWQLIDLRMRAARLRADLTAKQPKSG